MQLALAALIAAAVAWVFAFTRIARAGSLATFMCVLLLAIAAILFGLAVLGPGMK